MAARRKSRRTQITLRDPKKESVFKELTKALELGGLTVRREKLKQGHGWKVLSGSCRLDSSSLIFIDQRLSQDDQISFLVSKIRASQVEVPNEILEALPPRIAEQLQWSPDAQGAQSL